MKKILALTLALATMLGLCAPALAEGDAYVFWYTYGSVYLSNVRTALDAALAEKGLNALDQDANAFQQTQTDQINAALTSGASAMIVNMCDSGAASTAKTIIDAVKAAGLPLVFFNRALSTNSDEAAALVKSYEKCVFIGTNVDEVGITQGKMIGEYVLENFEALDLNGDGVISYVIFKGDEANREAIGRTKYSVACADEVLTAAGKPALRFYDEGNANKYLVDMTGAWSNTAAFDYMRTILALYNEANGNMVELVIANNDDMALGAVNALTNAGYNTGNQGDKVIPVFGVDATAAAKELIATGRMTGTVRQDAEGMADAVATIAANLVEGKDMFDGLNERYRVTDGWMVTVPYAVCMGEE